MLLLTFFFFLVLSGDQRLAHDSGRQVSEDDLKALGVLYWRIPIDDEEDGKKKEWEKKIGESSFAPFFFRDWDVCALLSRHRFW